MPWADNIKRTLGLHAITGADAAKYFGVSPQAVSEWISTTRKGGARDPNLNTLLRVAAFLEVPGDRLVQAEFADLLEHELADRERFERVERRIRTWAEGISAPAEAQTPKISDLREHIGKSRKRPSRKSG